VWSSKSVLNPQQREAAVAALSTEEFDILVIGGGVTGAGIALDAATRGLKVALVESQDYAAGTSSRSSKLIHGGLRYLEQYDFKLVREALHERELMVTTQAPHLVKPLSFLYPLHSKIRERTYVGAGIFLYDILRGLQRALPNHKHLSHKKVQEAAPCLDPKIVLGGIEYFDAQVDDARHTMMIIRTAGLYGAVLTNHTRVESLVRNGEKVVGAEVTDLDSGKRITVRAKSTIMAAGIWSNELHDRFGIKANYSVRMSKGVHIVVPRSAIDSTVGMILKTEVSVLFVIPWTEDKWLIGTTDTDYTGDRTNPLPDAADIDYIIEQVNKVLLKPISRSDLLGAYAGLRPLVSSEKASATTKVSREHIVDHPVPGFVSIAGGKYTTYRVMAKDAVDASVSDLGRPEKGVPESVTRDTPLLGADGFHALVNSADRLASDLGISSEEVLRLLNRYGSDIFEFASLIKENPELRKPISDGAQYLGIEIYFAASHEGAMSVSDVLLRRTRIFFESGDYGLSSTARVAEIISPLLGWSAEQAQASIREYEDLVQAERESILL
jgi:glycerol-3-phosphate dehydrogenase